MDPAELVPTQRYVLRSGVQVILDIADAFDHLGVDVFSLHGALLFRLSDFGPFIPFLPPVVEESIERDGQKVLLINDGMHRIYAARVRNRKITVVLARNVPPAYPYYAYPLPGGWDQVEDINELSEGYQKKEYRNPLDHKALFRDFNEIFEGVQKQRPYTRA